MCSNNFKSYSRSIFFPHKIYSLKFIKHMLLWFPSWFSSIFPFFGHFWQIWNSPLWFTSDILVVSISGTTYHGSFKPWVHIWVILSRTFTCFRSSHWASFNSTLFFILYLIWGSTLGCWQDGCPFSITVSEPPCPWWGK